MEAYRRDVDTTSSKIFNRILGVTKNDTQIKECLQYELSSYPVTLFNDDGMRKTRKAYLVQSLEVSYKPIYSLYTTRKDSVFIIDGGCLLYRVKWRKSSNFKGILNEYLNYLKEYYRGEILVVFDGYTVKNNTKCYEKKRRKKFRRGKAITFDFNTVLVDSQKDFLSNAENKKQLVFMLSQLLYENEITVCQSIADADYDIVKIATTMNFNKKNIIVVGDDTDLLVLLIHHTQKLNTYFLKSHAFIYYNICDLQNSIPQNIRKNILFFHSISGCDTNSCFYGKEKANSYDIIKNNNSLALDLKIFQSATANKDDLLSIGKQFIKLLYMPNVVEDSLSEMRYLMYKDKIKSKYKSYIKLNMAELPPTESAANFHILRSYCQIQQWLGKLIFIYY